MLSEHVSWVDIEPIQWANLWEMLYGPRRQPARLYGLLDGGRPIALVHSERGQVDLSAWPGNARSLQDVAAALRAQHEVEQVVLVERGDLEHLWDQQQRAYEPREEFDSYVLRIGEMSRTMAKTRAVCDPPGTALPGYPPIRYDALLQALRNTVGKQGHFVLAAYEGDVLWYSLAGSVVHGAIVTLTSSQGLLVPGAEPPSGPWRQSYRRLLEGCAERLGPPTVGAFMDLDTFKQLPFVREPRSYLEQAVASGRAVLDPWPESATN